MGLLDVGVHHVLGREQRSGVVLPHHHLEHVAGHSEITQSLERLAQAERLVVLGGQEGVGDRRHVGAALARRGANECRRAALVALRPAVLALVPPALPDRRVQRRRRCRSSCSSSPVLDRSACAMKGRPSVYGEGAYGFVLAAPAELGRACVREGGPFSTEELKTKIVTQICRYRALRGGLRLWRLHFEQVALAHLALALLLPRQDAL